jgi:hypothetical protein
MSNIDSTTGRAAIGRFPSRRTVTGDTFIEKVSALGTDEGAAPLYAGTAPMSLDVFINLFSSIAAGAYQAARFVPELASGDARIGDAGG